jgi:hypothetical protein
VETLACPSRSWTLAMSASWDSAFGRCRRPQRMHTQPVHFGIDPGLPPVFPDDVPVDGAGLQMLV